jgi:nucleoside-diphosphate-sugar epimerase
MKAFVVGGAGSIGSYLVKVLLDAGNNVRVLDLEERYLADFQHPKLDFVVGSMLDRKVVERTVKDIDVLYHLAHWPCAGHEVYEPFRFKLTLDEFVNNLTGTAYLLEASRKHQIKQFIYTSSAVVYGIQEGEDLNEESCCHPENTTIGGEIYGITKLAAERFCLLYNLLLGLPVTILRLHGVYRPDHFHLSQLVQQALESKPLKVSKNAGGQYAHIEDVVQAYLLVTLNEKAYGQIFNIGGPQKLDELELARFIVRKTDSKSQIELVSDPTKRMISVNISKANRLLNYNPKKGKKDLEQIIQRYIGSLKKARTKRFKRA